MLAVNERQSDREYLAEECRWIANTSAECRRDFLEAALCNLRVIVANKGLSAAEVASELSKAAAQSGLTDEIGAAAVDSLIRARLDGSRYRVQRDYGSTIDSDSILDPTDWLGVPLPEMEWLVDGMIPDWNVTKFDGNGGDGKTQALMQLLASTATGVPWLGFPTRKGKALGVFCEDDEEELHRRFATIARNYKCSLADLANVYLLSRVDEDNLLVTFDKQDRATPTQFYKDLTELAMESGARTVVLDSLHNLFPGNEIIRPQAVQFIRYLRLLARRIMGAVIFSAHPSLTGIASGSGSSGSTGWHNAVRSRLYLTRPNEDGGDDGVRMLTTQKQNYGPRGDSVALHWNDGVFVRTSTLGGDPFREAEAAFLSCLDAMTGQARFVSASPHSSTFAPKAFCRMPQARGFTRDKLHRAMDALFNAGKLRIEERRKANRHTIEVIVRVVT